jgi:RimJ/RimL family protein N-acetyltransferase
MPDAEPLPELIEGAGLVLRRWVPADLQAMAQAVSESVGHLRPWMDWAAQEPMALEARLELIHRWERDWLAGGDLVLGIFEDGQIVGGTGMHQRIGPGGIEIGYWVHPAHLRQGIASTASELVTAAAFSLPQIDRVEIHHDKANVASAAVPAKLGFTLVKEYSRPVSAPAEIGIGCDWRMERDEWEQRQAQC